MKFSDVMARGGAKKLTENGAVAYNTAGNGALLDLFSQIGALRPRDEATIERKFSAAFKENNLLATKMMFYAGDIRNGGLGERRTFRICLKWLAEHHPEIVKKNMTQIPLFNRFDSLFVLNDTPCEDAMWEFVAKTLLTDVKAMKQSKEHAFIPVSLLAKWMPSENTSSVETRKMAYRAMNHMRLTPRTYRKMLSALRKHINVVERQMSAGKWNEIDYTKVPSYAMHNYGSAFAKHDYDRFNAFLYKVENNEVKINASTMYPYDLVRAYMDHNRSEDPVVEAQWKALPNYLTEDLNAVVMADVSGSMTGRPMDTSIGLAIYFAQHNKGEYHNKYMTFTSYPRFVNIVEGASLYDNINQVRYTDIGYSTNLNAAFDHILNHAVMNHVGRAEMPKAIIVISDMEIDRYYRPNTSWDFIEVQRRNFAKYGYKLPKLIMLNVEAREDTFLSQNENVILLSGQSASTFSKLCGSLEGKTAYDFMLEILNSKAYSKIVI